MVDWLSEGANAKRYLSGNKSKACKELAKHMEEKSISEVTRDWKSIKARLAALLRKYYNALRSKNSTGWGTTSESTIQGCSCNVIFYAFILTSTLCFCLFRSP